MRVFLALVLGMLMILSGCTNLSGFKVRNATTQFVDGNYQTAFEEFGEVLAQGVDKPWLHYNMGNAAYMNGDFEQARKSYSQALESASEIEAGANVEYNMGNSLYRIAEQLEASDPPGALEFYNTALLQYKISMEQDADDLDAKFNYELTQRKIKELEDKLENQENGSDEGSEDQEGESDNSEQSEAGESGEQQGTSEQEEENAQDEDVSSSAEQEQPQTSEETDASSQEHEEQCMTMEEALMLLESMEDEEAERMNILVPRDLQEVEKDW